ncbi:ABC transporter substrate-binding protein [Nocardioides litoris]|uniref:ABC transporter substrate-binding protein n=1 Tax=Nocardioides litoris TaxID=1926648 RepID=UPI0011214644|nr:ABC transporter substrate-binding protein [Nocardioides litoris]
MNRNRLTSRMAAGLDGFKQTALLAAAGALVLAGCGAPGGGEAEGGGEVSILFVAGKSGPTATIVGDVTQGLEAAIAKVNDAGGVNGETVTLEVLDTGGDPTRAVSELQRRLSQGDKPDLVIPGVSSVESLALTPLLTREKIVSINNAASPELNKPDEYPYHFGYTPVPLDQQAGLADGLAGLEAESVVALLGNDPYGKSMGEAITERLEGTGVDLRIEEFKLDEIDLSIAYERAISSNPDAVFFEAIGDPVKRLVEARSVVGATDIPTIGGFGINSTDGGPSEWATDEQNENLYTEVFASQVYVAPEERSEALTGFFEQMEKLDGVRESVQSPFIFYDIVNLYAAAASEAGSTDAGKVKEQLEGDLDVDLVFWQQHSWSPDDHFPSPESQEFSLVPKGELVDGMFKPVG